jgi:hypothetical protein
MWPVIFAVSTIVFGMVVAFLIYKRGSAKIHREFEENCAYVTNTYLDTVAATETNPNYTSLEKAFDEWCAYQEDSELHSTKT